MHPIRIVMLTVICLIISLNVRAEEKKETPTTSATKEDYYTVKKGDTLWGISQKLLKSPWRWKILWDQNRDVPIPNPNLIYPGQRLRLIATATPAPVKPAPTPAAPNAPPAPLSEEVMPSSEPYVQPESQPAVPAHYFYSIINRAGFIRKEQAASEGVILTVRGNKDNISAGDWVHIMEQKDKPLLIGKRYTIFRPIKIKEGHNLIGIQHFFTGVVEIVSREEQSVIGKIIESYRQILKDDMLMPYPQRSPRIILAQSRKGIEGNLFLSEENARIFGEHTIGFINKGEKDGIAAGQTYAVCEPVKNIKDSSQETISILEIGSVIVIHAEKEISTVLITKSDKDIYHGALIRTPAEIR